MKKLQNKFKSDRFYNCTYALVLDHRHINKTTKTYAITMRFTIDRKSYITNIEGSCTDVEFDKICNLSQRSACTDLFAKRVRLEAAFEKYRAMLETLGPELTLDKIRIACTNVDKKNDNSFVKIWENQIHSLKTDEGGKRWATGESYECALNSFKTVLGDDLPKGFKVDMQLLNKWNDGMKNGIINDDVVIQRKLADATRGIYLRNCRTIWNKCISMGFMPNSTYPFSNKREAGKISIPKGENRKHEYLSVDKMTELYKLFIDKQYPETWTEQYTQRAHYSLGLFLVQYLCNGFNLADAGLLRYDDFYFANDRKAFMFERKKTKDRSEGRSVVTVPIIEPLQNILSEIAATPRKGERVFPYILNGCKDTDQIEMRKRVKQEGSNIKDRMERICKEALKWEISPSGTWARHSFATNLTHKGVDLHYISESMGHSESGSVTNIYIERYPLEKQMEYNNMLLDLNEKKEDNARINPDEMSIEELREFVKKMMAKEK